MNQLAVLTALSTILLALSHARPGILEDQLEKIRDSGVDDVPTELYSLNSPHSEGVFDGDGFSYNGKHLGPHITKTSFFKQMEDMMLVRNATVEEEEEEEDGKEGRDKRNAIRPHPFGANLWPNGLVPYEITSAFDSCESRIILQAFRHWEENTCLQFRRRTSADAYYIRIVTGQPGDCRSFVGRQHRNFQPQTLTLGPNCVTFSTVVHEIGHAIGLYHEHSRTDRDQYITVVEGNIFPGITGAFRISNGDTLGLGYDYASIMHYSSRAFSIDGRQETLRAKSPNIPIGGAEELSPLDIAKTSKLYDCSCPLPRPITVVPPPCRVSVPGGLSCGSVQNVAGGQAAVVSSPGYPSHRHNQECAWVFTCPSGYVPQIQFPGLGLERSSGCSKDYARIHYGASVSAGTIARYGGLADGRVCDSRYSNTNFFVSTDTVTVYYKTDSSGASSSGLQARVTCIDEDECQAFDNRCNTCRNTVGSFECSCNPGYYLSKPARTCYDINECAYQNGGCEGTCVNTGGSYRCECPSGQFLQAGGKSCGGSRPGSTRQPIAPRLPPFCPDGPTPAPECPALTNPDSGRVSVPSTSVGSTATYSCNTGFILIGSSTRSCQSGGTWSGTAPTCRDNTPSPIEFKLNGRNYQSGSSVSISDIGEGDTGALRCVTDSTNCCNAQAGLAGEFYYPDGSLVGVRASGDSLYRNRGVGYIRLNRRNGASSPLGEYRCEIPDRNRRTRNAYINLVAGQVTVTCDALSNPANGRVSVSRRTPGGTATYSCNSGYSLSGSSTRTCQSNGGWSGSQPSCQLIQCPSLTNPANGRVSVSRRTPGGTATYSCNSGYTRSGSSTRTCQSGGTWSGTAPTCQVQPCPPLPAPTNGRISISSTAPGGRATYSCNTGYSLSGSSTRTCQSGGTWSGTAPTCTAIRCPNLFNPTNGRVTITSNVFGGRATYSCNSGFTSAGGDSLRTCQSSGEWSGTALTCRAVTPTPLPIVFRLNGRTYQSSSSVSISDIGEGDTGALLCVTDSTNCCASQRRGEFYYPDGSLVGVRASGDSLYRNRGVRYIRLNRRNGASSPLGRYRCEIPDSTGAIRNAYINIVAGQATCPTLPNPSNGDVVVEGDTATYSCNAGYILIGLSTRSCQSNGVWSGTAPVCQAAIVLCPTLSNPANGRVTVPSRLSGGRATYSCNTGYTLSGSSTRTCQSNGVWSGSQPSCQPIQCPAVISIGNGVCITPSLRTVGRGAACSCSLGYTLVGGSSCICQSNGVWRCPSCQPIQCPVLTAPTNGRVSVPSRSFNSRATYSCNTGHTLSGSSTRTCQSNGVWSGAAPTCRADVQVTAQIVFRLNGRTYPSGSSVSISDIGEGDAGALLCVTDSTNCCASQRRGEFYYPGGSLVGVRASGDSLYRNRGVSYIRLNRRNGASSPLGEYRCEIPDSTGVTRSAYITLVDQVTVTCEALSNPANGRVSVSSRTPGGTATYSCNNGYTLSGSSTRTCQSNGVWSGTAPTCPVTPAQLCPTLSSPSNGRVSVSSRTSGGRATYSCNSGYTLSGSSTRTCQSGRWSGTAPTCQVQLCPILSNPANGGVSASSRSNRAVATYTCNPGYTLSGSSTRTCQSGRWSGTAPTCTGGAIQRIVFRLNGRTYPSGSSVRISDIGEGDTGALLCVTDSTNCCTAQTRLIGEYYYPDGSLVGVRASGDSLYRNRGVSYIRLNRRNGASSPLGEYRCEIPDSTGAIRNAYITLEADQAAVTTCPALSNPANGAVSVPTRTEGSVARYSCSSGYTLNGGATRTCQSNGAWSGSQPSCQLQQQQRCPALSDPDKGEVSVSSISPGGRATYSCDAGYSLSGSSTRTCQSNGVWSGTAPTCQAGFYLRSQFYSSGRSISLGSIGEGDEAALIFRTSNPNCCRTQKLGECYYPNGNLVGIKASGDELYRNRGDSFIRLNRQSSSRQAPPGQYCCVVPDADDSPQRVCVNIS